MVRTFALLTLLLPLTIPTTLAQSSTPTTAASRSSASPQASASIIPGSATYEYYGCYNETTSDASVGNVRALAGGNMTASDTMTVEQCFAFCGSNQFAGLEYGRECWCAGMLNSYAEKLTDANCSLACDGDKAEICGGALKLTAYQRKANAKSTGDRSVITSRGLLGALCLGIVLIL